MFKNEDLRILSVFFCGEYSNFLFPTRRETFILFYFILFFFLFPFCIVLL